MRPNQIVSMEQMVAMQHPAWSEFDKWFKSSSYRVDDVMMYWRVFLLGGSVISKIENQSLMKLNEGLCERIAKQSELLSKKAEK